MKQEPIERSWTNKIPREDNRKRREPEPEVVLFWVVALAFSVWAWWHVIHWLAVAP